VSAIRPRGARCDDRPLDAAIPSPSTSLGALVRLRIECGRELFGEGSVSLSKLSDLMLHVSAVGIALRCPGGTAESWGACPSFWSPAWRGSVAAADGNLLWCAGGYATFPFRQLSAASVSGSISLIPGLTGAKLGVLMCHLR
jgi:hypothetical protein